MRRHGRADGGSAEVDNLEVFLSFLDRLDFVGDGEAPAVEFLTEGHRNGVLKVGTAHLENVLGFFSLLVEGSDEVFNSLEKDVGAKDQGQVEGRRVGVVRGLTEVGVVVRGDLLVALREAEVFASEVAEHFVAVHVRGRASATLEPIGDELVVVLASDDLIAGPDQGVSDVGRDATEFLVRHHGGLLHIAVGDGEERFLGHRHFGDVEVVLTTHRLDAVVGFIRNLEFAKEVAFNTRHFICSSNIRVGPDRENSLPVILTVCVSRGALCLVLNADPGKRVETARGDQMISNQKITSHDLHFTA